MAIDLGEQVTRIQIRWEAKKKASAVIFADWKTYVEAVALSLF